MSLLKTNEIQNYNGSSLTLTASTVSTSAQLNTGGNVSVTGSLNVSDDSTTRTNLGLGTIATQDSDSITVTGGTATLGALTVSGSDSGDLVRITQTGSGNALVVEDSTNPDSTPFVVDSSGNVGIGTSPDRTLHVNSGGTNGIATFESTDATGIVWVADGNSANTSQVGLGAVTDDMLLYAGGSERMRIDSSGNVKINNLGSGDVYATSGTLYISSDIRLKNDLGVINESGIEIIKQLTPRYYSWKDDENSRQQLGFFAQEVFPILPEAVPRDLKYEQNGVDEDGEPILEQVLDENGEPDYQWGFATQPIVAMCVKAIQEQQTLIESQQSQIDGLTTRIEALETT